MKRPKKVTVLVDAATVPDDDPGFESLPDEQSTEYHVIDTLRELGYRVSIIGVHDDIHDMIDRLGRYEPDVVFNLTEQFAGVRSMDKNIAGVLELLRIPFTGSGPEGLMLCRDKRLCKQLLARHKIRVPSFVSLSPGRASRVPRSIHFPLVVKPALEDGSEGISNASVVWDEQALRERAAFVHERWSQDVIAEEYITGRELYVSVLGNKRLTVLPIRECAFRYDADRPFLATYHVKWNETYRDRWGIEFGFADLDAETARRIGQICKKVYRVLQIRDYGRIDLRLTPEGRLVVLEANPNPGLAYGEEVAESAERAGIGYARLVDRIVRMALRRGR